MNKMKKKKKDAAPSTGKKIKRRRKLVEFLSVFGFIKKDDLLQTMPFMLFLTLLAVVYIANNYMAEKTLRKIDAVDKEIKTLRSEHISLKSELNFLSNQSAVARSVGPYGIKESIVAPKKIIVQNTEDND
jgi:hypothetical protein